MKRIILIDFGPMYVTLRGLMVLLCLAAYACVCLHLAKKRSIKPQKVIYALSSAYVCMFIFGRAGYMLLNKNAVRNIFGAGDMTFLGFIGFFAGLRLYCLKSKKAFKRLIKLFAPPFFALAAALMLFSDLTAGKPTNLGLFSYTDVYSLKRANVPLIEGALLLLMMLFAYTLSKIIKKPGFKVKLLPMTIASIAIIIPAETLKDDSYIRLLGIKAEALIMWLCMTILLFIHLVKALNQAALPMARKLINASMALLPPVLLLFALAGERTLICYILVLIIIFAYLSPLFPYIGRPKRINNERKRSFS